MKRFLEKVLPVDHIKLKWVAIGVTVLISGLLALLGIFGFRQYGIALFVLIPVFIGANPVMLFGLRFQVTKKDAFALALSTLGLFAVGLLVCAIEGLICMFMAAPIAIFLTWIGSLIGYFIVDETPSSAPTAMLILMCLIPTMGFVERDHQPTMTSVVTSIVIDADPQKVWENVVEFPQLDEPNDFIFKAGIAYPINAKIEGVGVGAIRHCNFTTGSFVEPITVWEEPRLLRFDVVEQPAPMKELSFWDIDAPHLHDYFVSKQGQFKLTQLSNGKVQLEGTTWYYHKISPEFYWRPWSNYIIHKIHDRVLMHIKKTAESEQKRSR